VLRVPFVQSNLEMNARIRANAKAATAVAGVMVAALVAGLLALIVNLGILRAAGQPQGPGRLGLVPAAVTTPERGEPGESTPSATPAVPRGSPSDEPSSVASPGGSPRWSPPVSGNVGTVGSGEPGGEREHEFGKHNDD
jgi:hypothetical protein